MTDELFVNKYLNDNYKLVTNGLVFMIFNEKNGTLQQEESFSVEMSKIFGDSLSKCFFMWIDDNRFTALSEFNEVFNTLDVTLPTSVLLDKLIHPITKTESNYQLFTYMFQNIFLQIKFSQLSVNFDLILGRTNWELIDKRTNKSVSSTTMIEEMGVLYKQNAAAAHGLYDKWYTKTVEENSSKIMNISY